MGVAVLHNKMFIIFNFSSVVRVYLVDSIEDPLEEISIPDMKFPHDIVACVKTEKLFIADMQKSEAGGVWRMTAEGDRDIDLYLPSEQDPEGLWPRSLAAANGYLLVVAYPNTLLKYGVGGRRLCKVQLSRDVQLEHAVITNHDTFVVGLRTADNTLILVREVDTNGNTVRNCPMEFSLPAYLAADPAGRVLVADRHNNRVVLLDKRLSVKRVLLGGEQREPRRLLLRPELGELYVCGSDSVTLWLVGNQQLIASTC